jgi:hypothetical protein
MDEERLGGAIEDAVDEFAEHAADNLVFGVRGAVEKSAVLAALFQIAFGFEDFHHGHDGGVGDFAAFEKGFVDVADGGGIALPDELHDFEFLGSESGVLGSHRICFVVLKNSYVKRKIKIFQWAGGKAMRVPWFYLRVSDSAVKMASFLKRGSARDSFSVVGRVR